MILNVCHISSFFSVESQYSTKNSLRLYSYMYQSLLKGLENGAKKRSVQFDNSPLHDPQPLGYLIWTLKNQRHKSAKKRLPWRNWQRVRLLYIRIQKNREVLSSNLSGREFIFLQIRCTLHVLRILLVDVPDFLNLIFPLASNLREYRPPSMIEMNRFN